MKVLLLSTSDRIGGAAIACSRIFYALRKNGVDVKMLVRDKLSDDELVATVNTNSIKKFINFLSFCWERLLILFCLKLSRKNLFQVSLDNVGTVGLLKNPLILEADVINVHWTSQGMLSLSQIEKLLEMGKRLVFTMHDMHYFTGICHYARICTNYKNHCGNCKFVANGKREKDLSRRWFDKKMNIPNRSKISYVGCSEWLTNIARSSPLLRNCRLQNIPNPIDINVFEAQNSSVARNKFGLKKQYVILFGAMNIADKRKGFDFLVSALRHLSNSHPEYDSSIELLIFGQSNMEQIPNLPYPYRLAGYLSNIEDIVAAYSAASLYVIPSLEDNLPNTVMEALSCSTPCVAFDVGGLPQMIDHLKNGYLAKYMDFEDLSNGIFSILSSSSYNNFCNNARDKVKRCFAENVVAEMYKEMFS